MKNVQLNNIKVATSEDVKNLLSLIEKAISTHHGTMIVNVSMKHDSENIVLRGSCLNLE